MQWEEIRRHYPHQWLLAEAIKAHSESGKRILEQLTVVNVFSDPLTAMEFYKKIHQKLPAREFYVLHTNQETLDVSERRWLPLSP